MGSAACGLRGVTGVSGGPNPSGDSGRGAFTGVRGGVAWPGQAAVNEASAARRFKKIGNCPFNGGWVRNCWGRAEWDRLRNQSVLCSGSYMGAQPAIVNFETRLLNEVDAHDCHHKGVPSDQGYLNYLYYTGNLPAETFVETRGDGVVNTVGSLDGSRPRHAGYLPPTHVNIGEYWKIRDAAGYVLEDDMTTRSAAVHQWDRFGIEFHQFVSELGRDVRTR